MNKWLGCGRIVRDVEVRYTAGENSTAIARLTLAVDRKFKRAGEEQTADFIPCIAFGKTAEFIDKYFRKGDKMIVEGRIQTGSYTNKDGVKVYTTDIAVENVEFAEGKRDDGGQTSKTQPSLSDANDGFVSMPDGSLDEELPFN